MTSDEFRRRRAFELGLHRADEAPADADAELASLLEAQAAHLESEGWLPEAARAEALRRLGAPLPAATTRLQQSAVHREKRMRHHDWLEDLVNDLRLGFRALTRSPGLAAAVMLTLALPIGANTAIFSAVHAVILRPLPYADPGRLVALWEENPDFHWYKQDAAPANMYDWRDQAGVFSDVGGYASFGGTITLTGRGEPQLLRSQQVTGNLFSVLGIVPEAGRNLTEEETWSTAPRRAMLSYRAWKDRLGGDRALVGRSLELGGRPVEIVGVLPRRFAIPGAEADVWMPMRWDREVKPLAFFRRAHWIRAVGRLKPGVSPERANAALQVVVNRLKQDFPQTNVHMGAGMTPLHEFLVGNTRLPLLVMFGGVAVLLLIACANIGNLLLVRAAGRERETALRLALGAGRGRLIRQSLAESGLLGVLGGALGIALGWWGTRVLAAIQPEGLLPIQEFALSWTVVGYALLATVLSVFIFGLAPTLWTGRKVPADVLREEGRSASSGIRARTWGEALLVAQVGMALALTLGAGLLVRSYLLLLRVEPGFDPSNVLTVSLNLPGIRYDSTRKVLAFFDQLESQARGLPGVEAAALVSGVPLGPPRWSSEFAIEGRPPMERGGEVLHRELTYEYQKVMRVPLRKGRVFTAADREDAPAVVLVNEALAKQYFPGEDPVGRRVAFDREPDSSSTWRTIVGVVGDERQHGLGEPSRPEFLAPYSQESRSSMTLVLRSTGDPLALAPGIKGVVARLDPLLALGTIESMSAVRAASLGKDRFLTVLMLSFAGVGMALGLVGVYGVMAQLARRRMREMGIRIALGAAAGQVQWLVVRRALLLTGLGLGAGIGVALLSTRVIRTLLYQVAPTDTLTFVAVPAAVLLTALAAAWLPASRASRADPCQVLRAE